MNRIGLFLCLLLGLLTPGYAQQLYKGVVRDARTREPLAFVSLAVQGTKQGTLTDLDGRFQIKATAGQTLLVSYVGYQPRAVRLADEGDLLRIDLVPTVTQLSEVVVRPGENPAWAIVRNVLKNRSRNDPEAYSTYTCKTYNKSYYTIDNFVTDTSTEAYRNQVKRRPYSPMLMEAFTSQMHVWLKESVTEIRYQRPNQRKEIILATKSSFPGDFSMGITPTDFQPFGFYQEIIQLPIMERNYLNPIAEGTFSRYDFAIEDTLFHEHDSTYVLSFQPFPNKHFEGLKGVVYINTDGYAIENIIAMPADTNQKVWFRVQQQYQRLGGRWFPDWLQTDLKMPLAKSSTKLDVLIRNRSQVTEVQINPILPMKSFDHLTREQRPGAASTPDSVWQRLRADSLDHRERASYAMWDSLPQLRRIGRFLHGFSDVMQVLTTGTLEGGAVDLVVADLLRWNQYEGTRLGLGVQLTPPPLPWAKLYGYAAFGTADKALKYGGSLEANLLPRRDLRLGVSYRQDIAEPGQLTSLSQSLIVLGRPQPRNWLRSRMDSVQAWRVDGYFRPLPHVQLNLYGWREYRQVTSYPYQFSVESVNPHRFYNSELGLNVRIAPREQMQKAGKLETILAGSFPIVDVQVAIGIPALGGQFTYTKTVVQVDDEVVSKALGTSRFRLLGGWLNGTVPYPYLFGAPGSSAGGNGFYYYSPNTFQTMGLYEFASDRFAYLFWEHNFGRLLFRLKTKYSQPEISVSQHVGFGQLSNRKPHEPLVFRTLEKGYYESGLSVYNLLRFPFMQSLYMGLGGSVFRRWGPNQFPLARDNYAYRLTVTLSI
ncbi:hypothetical protein GCM10023189_18710 [Nibrella saemangeumensis]|uniref:CarboxypepD_reg-like domain-containing protein n=1 Tax=Nibrella saemangeumensis TaxID=1084526 RepID=A0ABP8MNN8_9BACT